MSDDLPENLRETRELLMRSAPGASGETPPPPPRDLIDDLEAGLAGAGTPAKRAPSGAPSRFGRLRRFLASPAFGVAAAIILVFGIALPFFNSPPKPTSETFRGAAADGAAAGEAQVRLILVGGEASALDPSLFDPAALTVADTAPAPESGPFPRVVVDFTTGEIVRYDAAGREAGRSTLPEDPAERAEAIAEAISRVAPD